MAKKDKNEVINNILKKIDGETLTPEANYATECAGLVSQTIEEGRKIAKKQFFVPEDLRQRLSNKKRMPINKKSRTKPQCLISSMSMSQSGSKGDLTNLGNR